MKDRGGWFLKYWGGAAYTKKGIPDLLACLDGVFFGIEVKAPDGEPTELQLVNLQKIRDAGGYGVLLYPKDFSQFKELVEHKEKSNAWYLENIQEQMRWKEKLSKGD
jgi:Holliday junction resolvase